MSTQLRPHFGTDGIRGNADQDLTDNFVFALGIAIGFAINEEDAEIVIGRDTRISGTRIEAALAAGLTKSGLKVINIGILPTPAISLYAEKRNIYACAITASHNPASDNGIKVFARGGTKTDEKFESEIERHIDNYLDKKYENTDLTIQDESDNAFTAYIDWLTQLFNDLQLANLTIGLDCANGAAYKTAPTIFEKFGATTIAINTENDGININKDCGATNLDSLEKFVRNNKVDIAFAFDGDADRIITLDENAKVYDGDYILALLADNSHLDPKTIVATSMSNGSLKEYLTKIETNFIETSVGDKNVAIAMNESKAKIGGEQSGHIIHRDYAPFGDGVLIALLVSQIFADKKKQEPSIKASEILNLFTPMVQLHEKVVVVNKALASSSDKIEQAIKEHLVLLGENARIVIRPSGTEDIVRIMVEANEKDLAMKSMSELIETVKESCKG